MLQLAEISLYAGFSIIVDATFLKKAEREKYYNLAEKNHVACKILYQDTSLDELKKRIISRQAEGFDPSEARVDILEKQLEIIEKLDEKRTKKNSKLTSLDEAKRYQGGMRLFFRHLQHLLSMLSCRISNLNTT